jgi:hypothetical protein
MRLMLRLLPIWQSCWLALDLFIIHPWHLEGYYGMEVLDMEAFYTSYFIFSPFIQ